VTFMVGAAFAAVALLAVLMLPRALHASASEAPTGPPGTAPASA
jgi:hypothetical protein